MRSSGRIAGTCAAGGAALLLLALAAPRGPGAVAELPLAYVATPLPAGIDSATTLRAIDAWVAGCADECATVVYAWTPRMPLSRAGVAEVAEAAGRLGVDLRLVAYEELADYGRGGAGAAVPVADAMLTVGALAHAPSLVVLRGGRPVGSAILGYKRAGAYEAAIARRLAGTIDAEAADAGAPQIAAVAAGRAPFAPAQVLEDLEVIGVPGAYFRWVPGREAVAYESGQRVYLLDLADGESRVAPGFIDFVPSPDGRFFVTPGEIQGGLEFYDADEVFDAVRAERPADAEPIFTDLRMRDQYPSVGILEQSTTRTLYRVMTSWFEGVVYRDYDVRVDAGSGVASVQPVGEPARPCAGVSLSTPIMSQDGLEVAGRDEATGTTKIFRILEGGRCEALTDFGMPTSKVAWHSSGRRLAFAIPRRRRGAEDGERGIFVLDRDGPALVRLEDSEEASRLAFPDFVGDDAVVFLIPGSTVQQPSLFRVVSLAP